MRGSTIIILRGGKGPQKETSLRSGKVVHDALKDVYNVIDVVIDSYGRYFVDGVEKYPEDIFRVADVVINALHGEGGEDGEIQRIMHEYGVAHTGPTAMGAILSYDKKLAREQYEHKGIMIPRARIVTLEEDIATATQAIIESIPFPVVLKPSRGGGAHNIFVGRSFPEVESALRALGLSEREVIAEEYIEGQEVTCTVIEKFRGQDFYTPIIAGMYFDEKGETTFHTELNLTTAQKAEIQKTAIEAHKALHLRHYSQSDFIIHPQRGVFLIETNALPPLHEGHALQTSLAAVGSKIQDFFEHIITLARRKRA